MPLLDPWPERGREWQLAEHRTTGSSAARSRGEDEPDICRIGGATAGSGGDSDGGGSLRHSIPTATVWRGLGAGVSIVGLIAGCGSGGSEADVSAQTEDAVPSDLAVSFVTAGEQAGWVAGVGGDQREVRLWRLTPDGAAAQVAELPELVSMDSAGIETQVAVAGLRCIENDPAEGCGASRAEVLLITTPVRSPASLCTATTQASTTETA